MPQCSADLMCLGQARVPSGAAWSNERARNTMCCASALTVRDKSTVWHYRHYRKTVVGRPWGRTKQNLDTCICRKRKGCDEATAGSKFMSARLAPLHCSSPEVDTSTYLGDTALLDSPSSCEELELTSENVEIVLDEVRPYLVADGGNCSFISLESGIVTIALEGNCGSCPSTMVTLKYGIEKRLKMRIPGVLEVKEQVKDLGEAPTWEAVETVLESIRPYLTGWGGASIVCMDVDEGIVSLLMEGDAAQNPSVRAQVVQRIRQNIPLTRSVDFLGDE